MSFLAKLFGFGKGSKRKSVSQESLELIRREWEQIDVLISQAGPSQLRQALIKADKTLDTALRDVVDGERMGERLKNAVDKFDPSSYDKVWKAHKIRNNLVHQSGYEPPHHMITGAIGNIRNGLRKLGVTI